MTTILTEEQFDELLMTWYKTIRSRDRKKAEEIREQVKAASEDNKFSDELLDKCLLMGARYNFLMGDVTLCQDKLHLLQPEKIAPPLRFFYHSFWAMIRYANKEYFRAIEHYEAAETYLPELDDPEEYAAFHYNKALQYYHLDINALCNFHLEEASARYQKIPGCELKVANCKSLQGLSYADAKEFPKAAEHLEEALAIALTHNQYDLQVVCQFNLGLCYFKQNEDEKGIPYLEEAVKAKDHPLYIQALFTLCRSLFRIDQYQQALNLYKRGIEDCKELRDIEYTWHFTMLYAKYVNQERYELIYEAGISFFEKQGLYYSMRFYARELSEHYWNVQNLPKFRTFHQIALSQNYQ